MWLVNPKDKINAASWVVKNVVKRNKDYKTEARKFLPNVSAERAYMKYAQLHTGRTEGVNPLAAVEKIGLQHLRNDKFKFLKKGELLPEQIKKVLGYKTDLKNQVANTAMEMVSEITTKKQYDKMPEALLMGIVKRGGNKGKKRRHKKGKKGKKK